MYIVAYENVLCVYELRVLRKSPLELGENGQEKTVVGTQYHTFTVNMKYRVCFLYVARYIQLKGGGRTLKIEK